MIDQTLKEGQYRKLTKRGYNKRRTYAPYGGPVTWIIKIIKLCNNNVYYIYPFDISLPYSLFRTKEEVVDMSRKLSKKEILKHKLLYEELPKVN